MDILILLLLGLAFGSFITALTWRLHENKDFVTGRSQCESCGHQLGVLDLIPVVSWLILRGRCRYCKKQFGWDNPVIELSTAAAFIISYIYWPLDFAGWQAWASFILWLIYVVMLIALLVYDLRWMLLPNKLVFPLIGLAIVDVIIRFSASGNFNGFDVLQHVLFGAIVLSGFYWLLYTVSKGKWIGFGDVKLGLFMGILLGWKLSLLMLFLSNIVGFFIVVPGLLMGKLNGKSRIPFGPFLIIAFFIAGLWGNQIVDWYISILMQGY